MKKLLIVCYSWSNGNTLRIAKQLQAATGADLARLDTLVPYSGSYDDVVNRGQDEVERGFEPELKPLDADLSAYDAVAVGTPTWWYTMAPAVKTFLHSQNWQGKTVIPFATNGGWQGHVIRDMTDACRGAEAVLPMQVQFDSEGGSKLITPEREIDAWVDSVRRFLGGNT